LRKERNITATENLFANFRTQTGIIIAVV